MNDEKKGLQAGLSGVGQIELLEINVDNALRYLSSIPQRDGTFKADGFPVKRGTLVKLDREAALLWVHGVSRALGASDGRRSLHELHGHDERRDDRGEDGAHDEVVRREDRLRERDLRLGAA